MARNPHSTIKLDLILKPEVSVTHRKITRSLQLGSKFAGHNHELLTVSAIAEALHPEHISLYGCMDVWIYRYEDVWICGCAHRYLQS